MLNPKIRNDFSSLSRKKPFHSNFPGPCKNTNITNDGFSCPFCGYGKVPIYFDSACLALKPKQVRDAMNEYYDNCPACGGHGRSAHWFAGEVGEKTHYAREIMQKLINAKKEEEIIWTRNTTEGINLVANSFHLEKGDVVLTTDREHNSNLLPWQVLVQERGIRHIIIPSKRRQHFQHRKT